MSEQRAVDTWHELRKAHPKGKGAELDVLIRAFRAHGAAVADELRAVWSEGYSSAMQHGCDIDKCADAGWEDVDEWLGVIADEEERDG